MRLWTATLFALAVALPVPAVAATPACHFEYTDEIREKTIVPELDRITGGRASRFRSESPMIFVEDDGNVRLQFTFRGLDGDEPAVTLNPCSGAIVRSANFPANPEFGPCPPEAPPGAWCIKPDDKKN